MIHKPKLDRTVMELSWNKQAKPTTKPVNTSVVVPTFRQYSRSDTRESRKRGKEILNKAPYTERRREKRRVCPTALKLISEEKCGVIFGWSNVICVTLTTKFQKEIFICLFWTSFISDSGPRVVWDMS